MAASVLQKREETLHQAGGPRYSVLSEELRDISRRLGRQAESQAPPDLLTQNVPWNQVPVFCKKPCLVRGCVRLSVQQDHLGDAFETPMLGAHQKGPLPAAQGGERAVRAVKAPHEARGETPPGTDC